MAKVLDYLDAPMWRAVRDLYLRDKVVEALEEAENLGGQDSNDLYAEAEVRKRGSQWKIRPWLTIEAIESEAGHHLHETSEMIATACEDLSMRFGWDNRESTLIALLPQDVEAPWMPGRWGYFVDKTPYDKICVPHHLVHDVPNLIRTIQHEFMHDISTNVTNGHIPRWFSEAMSTYAEGRFDAAALNEWRGSQAEWLSSVQLDALVSTDNRQANLQRSISRAYAQANFIARYLSTLGGDAKLAELLRELGDESFLHNLETQLLLRSRMDASLRRVYRLSESELFDQAHAFALRNPAAPS
jgi:hypothetical protein